MGLMDKLWEEVFPASPPQAPASKPASAAPTGTATPAAAAGPTASSGAAVNVPRAKLRPGLSLDIHSLERSESAQEGQESAQSPPPSPSPSPLPLSASETGRASNEFAESRSSGWRPAVSQGISITRPARHSLDSARSLPPGFRYMPEILSPGKGRDENVWRSVFNPGSTNRDRMDALGASKFDKADPKGPSVYDWFYRKECRPQYR